MKWFTVALRVTLIQFHIVSGVLTSAIVLPWVSSRHRDRLVQRWSRRLLKHLRIRVLVDGNLPTPDQLPVVLTSNHVSWVDIFAIHAVHPVRFVSKSEVRQWPVFGWLAAKTGTLFLVRASSRQTVEVGRQMVLALSQGDCLGLFPESTTSDGTTILPFRSAMLQAAVACQSSVLPVALRYRLNDGSPNPHVPFVGDMTFIQSLAKVLTAPPSRVEIRIGEPVNPEGLHRRDLARELENITGRLLASESR
jgi:1-acyl-sn-glycerol-3-phosphate acyltransferase